MSTDAEVIVSVREPWSAPPGARRTVESRACMPGDGHTCDDCDGEAMTCLVRWSEDLGLYGETP